MVFRYCRVFPAELIIFSYTAFDPGTFPGDVALNIRLVPSLIIEILSLEFAGILLTNLSKFFS